MYGYIIAVSPAFSSHSDVPIVYHSFEDSSPETPSPHSLKHHFLVGQTAWLVQLDEPFRGDGGHGGKREALLVARDDESIPLRRAA